MISSVYQKERLTYDKHTPSANLPTISLKFLYAYHFRISQAAYHGHYLLIDKIYRNDSLQNLNLSEPEINATHTTLKLLYDDTAHDKRDMIVR